MQFTLALNGFHDVSGDKCPHNLIPVTGPLLPPKYERSCIEQVSQVGDFIAAKNMPQLHLARSGACLIWRFHPRRALRMDCSRQEAHRVAHASDECAGTAARASSTQPR